jgi:flagellar biosynthesis protein
MMDKKAVALKYDGLSAPRVTAKGEAELAHEIMAIAEAFDVPTFQQSDLAELLYRLDLNEEVPPALYIAVAEIMSFAYMLSGRTPWDN